MGAETPTLVAVTVHVRQNVAIGQTKVRSKEKFADITAMTGASGFVTRIEDLLLSLISPPRTCVLSRDCHRTRE
jgi:hypothetical protein